jgi:glycosyltransferase involved in cell wall biosynthesis
MARTQSDRRRLFLMGDARQVHLLRWARYFDDAGYEVLTFSLEEPDGEYPGRVRMLSVPGVLPDALRYPLSAPVAARLAARFDPHVVNAHFTPNYGVIATLIGRSPWVLSTWGSDIMTAPDRSPFHMWRTRRVLASASYVTSDAAVMTERLQDLGVPEDHILTFPYGVDPQLFHPAEHPAGNGPRIVSNRKLEAVYSIETVIDAFSAVHEAFPAATLTVAGDGSQRIELMRRSRKSVGSAAVTFVGAVDHDRMPTLLRDNDLYVSTSLSDTTSVSLLEAMACGLFPVVSDIPANREWITPGENGVLVPVGSPMKLAAALIEAWRDRELVARARRINQTLVRERATWSESMRPVHELFDTLAQRSN